MCWCEESGHKTKMPWPALAPEESRSSCRGSGRRAGEQDAAHSSIPSRRRVAVQPRTGSGQSGPRHSRARMIFSRGGERWGEREAAALPELRQSIKKKGSKLGKCCKVREKGSRRGWAQAHLHLLPDRALFGKTFL